MLNLLREHLQRFDHGTGGYPGYLSAMVSAYALMGLSLLLQLALAPFYLSILGKYQFGILMMLLSFVNFSAFGIAWITGGAIRIMGEFSVHNDSSGFSRAYVLSKIIYVGYAVGLSLIAVLLAVGFKDALTIEMPVALRDASADVLLTACLYYVALYDYNVERIALAARRHQAVANGLDMVGLVVFAASVFVSLRNGGGLASVLGSLALGTVISRLLAAVYWLHTEDAPRWQFPGKESRPILLRLAGKTSLGYFLYGAFILVIQSDTLLVGWLGGAKMAAEFVLIWKIPELLIQVVWRIPGNLEPYIISLDARGEHTRLQSIYRSGLRRMLLLCLGLSLTYALLGHFLVKLWVGSSAPSNPWAYVAAAGAFFWLASARWPSSFAFATIRLAPLVKIVATEAAGKLLLAVLIFPMMGYLAPLAAVNIVYGTLVFWMYMSLYNHSQKR